MCNRVQNTQKVKTIETVRSVRCKERGGQIIVNEKKSPLILSKPRHNTMKCSSIIKAERRGDIFWLWVLWGVGCEYLLVVLRDGRVSGG